MTYKIDEAKKAVAEALDGLAADTIAEVKDDLFQDAGALIKEVYEGNYDVSIGLAGLDWKLAEGDQPLTVYLLDLLANSGEQIAYKMDLIGDLIDSTTDGRGGIVPLEAEDQAAINRAIAALQSGIDRLRAHEAKCSQAQP